MAGKAAGGRKLIAVVYADMVGYSRLIGLDDAGTLRRLRTLRRALIDPAIREYGGRVAQTGGDSLLVEFGSIDGAVRCAVKIQQQVPVYDGDQPPDRRIRFRIGINIGDVIPHGTDLHGDGVNVAARLEAASPVGGICVSRTVKDHVHGRLDLAFEPIGELTLKNIARPVEAFVLRLDPGAAAQAGDATMSGFAPQRPAKSSRFRSALAAAAATLLVCVAAGAGWWLVRKPAAIPKASETAPSAAISQLPRRVATQTAIPPDVGLANAPRLSVVVLPLNNLGGDGASDDVADRITEDLTTELSRVPDFLVIARNSAFTYKGKQIDVRRVGEELGVRYAVEGSVRKVGGALRVTAQLNSTETGTHIWGDHFEVALDGVGYGVDEIVRHIGLALNRRIVDVESARSTRERPSNPDVTDILLRARSIYNRPVTPARQAELVPLYERAVELDPSSATALAGLAEALLDSIIGNLPADPAAPVTLRRAEELLSRAELLHPEDITVMWVRVYLLRAQNRCPAVIASARRAIEAYPSFSATHFAVGSCLLSMGRSAEAIPELEYAIRINPRNSNNFTRYQEMGFALTFLERYDGSIAWFQRALAAHPGDSAGNLGNRHAAIAAAQALAGLTQDARATAAEAMQLRPTITARGFYGRPVMNPVFAAQMSRLQDGLRLAGIRDHADEDADPELASDDVLRTNYEAPTPITAPGARTIRTPDLTVMLEQRKPLVLDVSLPWGRSILGAIGLWGAGIGGSVSDEFQVRLGRKMQQLTHGDRSVPVVTMGWNAERYQGRNLALRLVALGYGEVYWYRGGREAWEAAGLPETELALQDW